MNTTDVAQFLGTATHSPEDNKLRFYPFRRLAEEVYKRVKEGGFSWAPRQGLFVAPMWTPEREDLLLSLCGAIGDEDTSLAERAEQRAERFEGYRDNRRADAESARSAVAAIADHIPFGQPILIGHHSEARARRDAEKIENGMRKAVKMWETSTYWADRAQGAIAAAKYKELPAVRARRIKKLEAELRKQERIVSSYQAAFDGWKHVATLPEAEQHPAALALVRDPNAAGFTLARKEGDKADFPHPPSAYDALSGAHPSLYAPRSVVEVVAAALRGFPCWMQRPTRWLKHYENRIVYERAMLAAEGGTVADQNKPEKGGACKCWASPRGGWSYIQKVNRISVTVLDNWGNDCDQDGSRNFTRTMPFDQLTAVMSAAAVQAARAEGRLSETSDKTGFHLLGEAPKAPRPAPEPDADAQAFAALKTTLREGVHVVAAPQLFPTPPELARRLVDLADIQHGHSVLEPSAGTGNLIDAIREAMAAERCGRCAITAVEVNHTLASGLRQFDCVNPVHAADFLELTPASVGMFERIVMNPPFEHADDIKHILHARTFLRPGGRLVAICANGTRQNAQLKPIAAEWYDLPPGTFEASGTNVNSALLVIET